MDSWSATSFGAFEVPDRDTLGDVELVVLPTRSSEPRGLVGEPADFFRRLVASDVDSETLTEGEHYLLGEFEQVGLASRSPADPNRLSEIDRVRFLGPLHELVSSLVLSLARAEGLRAMIIKGPALEFQGLRREKHSGDVDVWAHPSDVDALADLLAEWGWTRLDGFWDGTDIGHSVTLARGTWGCEIDVHKTFPGIGLDADAAFESIRRRATSMRFASVAGLCPNPTDHAIIAALHYLRPRLGRSTDSAQLGQAVEVLRVAGVDCVSRAFELGAAGPLHPALREAFPDFTLPSAQAMPANWSWRLARTPFRAYLKALRMVPVAKRLKVLTRVIWPTNAVTVQLEDAAIHQEESPFRLKVRRLFRGVRGNPSEHH